ncbi:PAC2 family protein [Cutibacterium acnes]|jgi:hypothetical protein|uniref:PAC2 family protein n=1 Tax=Cutibacterium acnes TaxID=1747 RepID=UPI00028A4A72|nr:PAC2 family protein [Cutibacterium acnes]AFU40907.1 hypothetical protein PAC1_05760 [Cutibacterium acnes C1]MBT9633938.1 PAC2 family protein [Cutibacterium acnes]MBU5409791.1 PAC2 family protein [Cutibacterium acnes]MCT7925074.1 PAC2 family protein [Cutibacterium acnes]RKI34924.1 PAC2 family protein [Cutibacterium acnes]
MDRQSNRFSWHPGIVGPDQEVSALITLVQSFSDTGLVQARVRDAILSQLPHHELGEFDIDLLLDHRDSRQPIIFDTDHFEGYERPRLVLHEVTDQLGQAFLVLEGPEPALGWESLVSSLTSLVDSMGIRLTVITDSIPIPTPHTRPAIVTRWASRPELILGSTSPFGRLQVPASFPVVLGQRLGETNHAVIGLASHVPHYLADLDYPESARALVEALRGATGLALPINSLAVAANTVRAEIDTQVNNSEELKAMLHALEEQYDSRVAQRELGTTQVAVPDAEDIGAEVEDFLRSIDEDYGPSNDDPDTQGSGPRRSSDDTSDDDKPDYHPRRGGDLDN